MSKKLWIILSIVLAVAVLAVIRFWTPEDTWLCVNNQWVKHGNPSSAMPTTGCGQQTACTEEAKQCPDGSYVGRTGPNCEFAKCLSEILPGFTYFGNEVQGDFNNDGLIDRAFLVTQQPGGSGTFYYLAVLLAGQSGDRALQPALLGDRIAPQTTQFTNGQIIVNFADRAPSEPMTAKPSVGVSKYFKVENGQLLADQQVIPASFTCRDNKSIQAKFYKAPNDQVDLILSDGRSLTLPRAISASGARYANTDESFVFWNKGDTAFIEEHNSTTYQDCLVKTNTTTQNNAGLANPASVNCQQKGGTLVIQNKPDGGQYGLCYFEDNRACEEWAMFRGDCPIGGVKTTGFDTDAQKFCAWSGGSTLAVPNAVCTFKDGSKCLAEEFYNGTCKIGG